MAGWHTRLWRRVKGAWRHDQPVEVGAVAQRRAAFAMSPVFGPNDRVRDVRIPHRSTAPIFSHSEYWTQDDAVDAMRDALERASAN